RARSRPDLRGGGRNLTAGESATIGSNEGKGTVPKPSSKPENGDIQRPVSSLSVIVQSSLGEEGRRSIRAGVGTGEIMPGEIYSAPSLASRLGVSATPVREALLDLANEGLVEPVRNRGFRVVVLDDSDLDEIFELRTMLEVPSVGRIAGRLDQAQLDHMWSI